MSLKNIFYAQLLFFAFIMQSSDTGATTNVELKISLDKPRYKLNESQALELSLNTNLQADVYLVLVRDNDYYCLTSELSLANKNQIIAIATNYTINQPAYKFQFNTPKLSVGNYIWYCILCVPRTDPKETYNWLAYATDSFQIYSPFVKIVAGDAHSLALREDETVWSWGNNDENQLGRKTLGSQLTPVVVDGLDNVSDIACGQYHSVALKKDGTVWTWGNNNEGQCGFKNTLSSNDYDISILTPTKIPNLDHVVSIWVGPFHSFAVKSDGSVWGWGRNSEGQLGIGRFSIEYEPTQIPLKGKVTKIVLGYVHTAVLIDNRIWCMGSNSNGQLGLDFTISNQTYPTSPNELPHIKNIFSGLAQAFAIMTDDSIYAWGDNSVGQLGVKPFYNNQIDSNGWEIGYNIPVTEIANLKNILSLSSSGAHTLIITKDNKVLSFGSNDFGQLGDNSLYLQRSSPETIESLHDIELVATGYYHNLALMKNGSVWAWGANWYGQVGNGNQINQSLPVCILTSDTVVPSEK